MKTVVSVNSKWRAFTLIELMIVVSILGILAAIVIPEFQNHQKKARETQAKANLKLLRDAIERFYVDHGVPPGYLNGDTSQAPSGIVLALHLQYYTSKTCQLSMTQTSTYRYGPYVKKIPPNPFNKLTNITIVPDGSPFPNTPYAECGWMYQGSTRKLRLAYNQLDSEFINYYDY